MAAVFCAKLEKSIAFCPIGVIGGCRYLAFSPSEWSHNRVFIWDDPLCLPATSAPIEVLVSSISAKYLRNRCLVVLNEDTENVQTQLFIHWEEVVCVLEFPCLRYIGYSFSRSFRIKSEQTLLSLLLDDAMFCRESHLYFRRNGVRPGLCRTPCSPQGAAWQLAFYEAISIIDNGDEKWRVSGRRGWTTWRGRIGRNEY